MEIIKLLWEGIPFFRLKNQNFRDLRRRVDLFSRECQRRISGLGHYLRRFSKAIWANHRYFGEREFYCWGCQEEVNEKPDSGCRVSIGMVWMRWSRMGLVFWGRFSKNFGRRFPSEADAVVSLLCAARHLSLEVYIYLVGFVRVFSMSFSVAMRTLCRFRSSAAGSEKPEREMYMVTMCVNLLSSWSFWMALRNVRASPM